MKVQKLRADIEGPLLVFYDIFEDKRGYLFERFNGDTFDKIELPTHFRQDNQVFSKANVLRGFHYQTYPTQGKLIWAITGRIFDVLVDLRPYSKSFLKWVSVEMNSQDYNKALWIPPGFAHGYCVLGSDPALIYYKVTEFYNPDSQVGFIWDDLDLKIPWPVKEPLLSDKDKNFPTLKEFRKNFNL